MPVSIALCIITFQRPAGLRELLVGIGALEVEGLDLDVRVVVVDNDARESARPVVDRVAPALPFPVTYATESEPGIPFARNRALAVAGEVDVIGWIDDDEVPDRGWLAHLVRAQRDTGADVVIGPSVPQLPAGTPSWLREGDFFERTRFASGTTIPANYARTSGVLVRRAAMPQRHAVFSEALRHTGGSDRHLFVEMERSGARFVWVDEALVRESVPRSRARLGWVLQRAFRIGNSRSAALVREGVRRRAQMAKGLVRIATGVGTAVAGARRGPAEAVRGLRRCCYGAGLVTGALGYSYQEYRRHHGS